MLPDGSFTRHATERTHEPCTVILEREERNESWKNHAFTEMSLAESMLYHVRCSPRKSEELQSARDGSVEECVATWTRLARGVVSLYIGTLQRPRLARGVAGARKWFRVWGRRPSNGRAATGGRDALAIRASNMRVSRDDGDASRE